jgi:hypothetical protein
LRSASRPTCIVIDNGETEASESAAAGAEVTIANRNHLRRLMNLCVGLFYALRKFDWEINLARLGTHVIEGHFGIVRSALRGQGQWNFWKGAEAFAALVRAIKEELGLKARARARRIRSAGALAPPTLAEEEGLLDQATQPGAERGSFLAAVALSVRGEYGGLEALWQYTTKLVAQLSLHPIRTDSEPSLVRGRVREARYTHPPRLSSQEPRVSRQSGISSDAKFGL